MNKQVTRRKPGERSRTGAGRPPGAAGRGAVPAAGALLPLPPLPRAIERAVGEGVVRRSAAPSRAPQQRLIRARWPVCPVCLRCLLLLMRSGARKPPPRRLADGPRRRSVPRPWPPTGSVPVAITRPGRDLAGPPGVPIRCPAAERPAVRLGSAWATRRPRTHSPGSRSACRPRIARRPEAAGPGGFRPRRAPVRSTAGPRAAHSRPAHATCPGEWPRLHVRIENFFN